MGILNAVGKIFGVVGNAVDEFHTSEEEKLDLKAKLLAIQVETFSEAMELEKAQINAQRDVIVAEAQSESWITRNWRPVTMLSFVVLMFLIGFGVADVDLLSRVPDKLWTAITVGIGGYIASRGAEKIIPSVAEALKNREET